MKSSSLITGLVAFLLVVGIASAAYIEYYGTITGTAEVEVSSNWVGWWRFNEGEGDTAVDSSSYGNNGIIHGANWTSAGDGTALEFDGKDDYVEIPNDDSLNPSEITVSLWIKSSTSSWSDWGCHVSKRNAYIMHPASGTSYSWYIYKASGSHHHVSYDAPFDITNWHQYVGTYNGSALKLYMDGQEVARDTIDATMKEDGGHLLIGKDDGNDRWFKGKIDDVRIFNVSLSQEEIKNSFESSCEKYNAC